MKNIVYLIAGLLCLNSQAALTTDQVVQEFHEPGHIPQGLKPRSYHKLHEVIPPQTQKKIKQKKVQDTKEKKETKKVSFFNFLPSAEAAGKSNSSSRVVPAVQPATPVSHVDLREFDSPIRNQWDGTCTAHGLIATLENHLNRVNHQGLSTRYFWSQYQKYSAQAAIQAATANRQIAENLWPQNKLKPTVLDPSVYGQYQMTGSAYLGDNIPNVIQALNTKTPVYVAMSVPSDMASCRATIRPTTGITSGGHALAVVGYVLNSSISGGGYLILKNSWGTECGDAGYQYFPMSLCDKRGMYCMFWSIQGAKKI